MLRRMFSKIENLLNPTASEPMPPPTDGLLCFYWHHVRQVRLLILALFGAGLITATLDSTIPVFIGRVVGLLSYHTE